MTAIPASPAAATARQRLLPRLLPIDSTGYYVFLGLIAIFILGPLGGITASYMNFSIGFFVGGQVLAGILGSTVTYFYGPEGKHGANYMQTAAASVASMSAMGVLIQAMVWLGLPEPATWHLFAYFLCTGMFGIGVGMIFTPVLVDRLQLSYPSGLAVANILRALTDIRLLKRSVGQLFSGMGLGFIVPMSLHHIKQLEVIAATGISSATLGAGMIVGARIGIPAIAYAFLWERLAPWLREMGWLGANDPYRKFAFIVALGTIMGAAVVDIALIIVHAVRRLRGAAPAPVADAEEWKRTSTTRLLGWVAIWGVAVVAVTAGLMDIPLGWVLFAVAVSFPMMLVNGISLGITDSNPISSAFVLSVVVMAAVGLVDPIAGLLAGSIVFVVTCIGGDMQQDRSTGWRLGTPRTKQFRFQVVGVLLGAVLAVYMAKLFMEAYPILKIDAFANPSDETAKWNSAMTYKFVGALRGLTNPTSWQVPAMLIGVAFGVVFEVVRKVVRASKRYQAWAQTRAGGVFDFCFDSFLVSSPYASSFAGFVDFNTSLWFGGGGVLASAFNTVQKKLSRPRPGDEALPEDMSTVSLVGGGLIAGDALAALLLGIIGLLALV